MEYSVKIITYGSKLITILYSNEVTRATRAKLETELRLSLLHFTHRLPRYLCRGFDIMDTNVATPWSATIIIPSYIIVYFTNNKQCAIN